MRVSVRNGLARGAAELAVIIPHTLGILLASSVISVYTTSCLLVAEVRGVLSIELISADGC